MVEHVAMENNAPMRHTASIGRAFVVAVLTLATIVGCSELQMERYGTMAEARAAGLFTRGWVPDILPDTATALVGLHDLDTNARCAGARFAPRDRASIRDSALRAGFAVHDGVRPAPPFPRCPFAVGAIVQADEVLRRRARDDSEFLILTPVGQLHFWSGAPHD